MEREYDPLDKASAFMLLMSILIFGGVTLLFAGAKVHEDYAAFMSRAIGTTVTLTEETCTETTVQGAIQKKFEYKGTYTTVSGVTCPFVIASTIDKYDIGDSIPICYDSAGVFVYKVKGAIQKHWLLYAGAAVCFILSFLWLRSYMTDWRH